MPPLADRQPFQTLGLDVGTNSLGWGLVSNDADGDATSLVDAGVRIFQEAVDAKTREPKNKARQRARAARRILARRKQRKSKLRNFLIRHGLLPQELSGHPQPEVLLNALDKLDGTANGNPYLLRKRGLDEPLTLPQLGRVLMHLCARRGFQSNRKSLFAGVVASEVADLNDAAERMEEETGTSTAKDEEDLGVIKREIAGLRADIEAQNCRTLGEYLARLWEHDPLQRLRKRHTDRQMFRDEFDSLWSAQSVHHSTVLTDELKIEISNIIFFQRPLKSQKGKVGICTLEPQRKRAIKARLDVQEYLIRQDLVHLELLNVETRRYERLTPEQQQTLFDVLQKQKSLTWAQAKKAIGVIATQTAKFNTEVPGGKRQLIGNRVVCDLRAALPDRWNAYTTNQQFALVEDLTTMSDKTALYKRLMGHWALPRDQAYTLATLELPLGYISLSVKAVNKLLTHLRRGLIYSEARVAAGYGFETRQQKALALLPPPPDVRNPVVMKALHEVRKVVNAVIRAYGKPQVVRVEMARDIAMSPDKLARAEKQNKDNEKQNREAEDKYRDVFPSGQARRDDKIKYRLWKECGGVCPYTGKAISMTSLFTSGQWDIEHILPESRTLDDSYMNKTLCDAEFNRLRKKGQTPWEIFGQGQQANAWKDVLQRIKSLPLGKQRKFTQKELGPIEDFISRQLNDTRHIAVAVKNYLGRLGVDVQFTRGSMTADLRHWWGLNRLLSEGDQKNRSDHRHHALDAIAIALTTRQIYRRLHENAVRRETTRGAERVRHDIPLPWAELRSDAETCVARMIVSHAPSRKLSGALHEDTAYGLIRKDGEPLYVVRKTLDGAFDAKQAEKIVDEAVRGRVLNRLAANGGDAKKAFSNLDSDPLYLSKENGVVIRKVRIAATKVGPESAFALKDRRGVNYKHLKYGNNSHVEIVEHVVSGKREGRYVTTKDAAHRARVLKQPVVQRDHGPEWRFVMSLAVNDLLQLDAEYGRDIYRVQVVAATNETVWLRHQFASRSDATEPALVLTPNGQQVVKPRLIKNANSLTRINASKVYVDPIGRIATARD